MADPNTLEKRAAAIEQSAARLRRHWPLSRRQQLMLVAKRVAALQLRKEAARERARVGAPPAPTESTKRRQPMLDANPRPDYQQPPCPAGRAPGCYLEPAPYRVLRLIRNPAATISAPRLTRAALRIIKA